MLGKIIAGELDPVTKHRKSVPPNVDVAIRKALEKVPADRFGHAAEFARALAEPGFRHGAAIVAGSSGSRICWGQVTVAASSAALITALLVAASLLPLEDAGLSLVRFTIPVTEGTEAYLGGQTDAQWGRPAVASIALSPDGTLLAYSAWEIEAGGSITSRLYLRRLEQDRANALPDTDGASSPFFSPDGQWIGFFVGTALRRVQVDGGSVETIVADARAVAQGRGVSWGDDGTIVYGGRDGLYQVSSNGGEPTLIAEVDTLSGEFFRFAQPQVLPGNRAVLFHGMRSMNPETAEIFAQDLATGERTSVMPNAMDPRYVDTGHLLFMRQGTLMAVRFDSRNLVTVGEPMPVQEDVMQSLGMPNDNFEVGAGQLAVSSSGHLVYAEGGIYPRQKSTIVRVTASGELIPLGVDTLEYFSVRASPSGDRLVTWARIEGVRSHIYVHDLGRDLTTRLNTGGYVNWWPVWAPDGGSIAFSSDREGGVANVYVLELDGDSAPRRVAPSSQEQRSSSWSPDGVLTFVQRLARSTLAESGDIWTVRPGEPAVPVLQSPAAEQYPELSPDGRWLAYGSNATGPRQVYLRPYPGPGPAIQISPDGGSQPAWSRDGMRIFFTSGQPGRLPAMMAVDVTPGTPPTVGRPRVIIDPWTPLNTVTIRSYDVLPDGSFVGVLDLVEQYDDPSLNLSQRLRRQHAVSTLHVVLNFTSDLRRRVN